MIHRQETGRQERAVLGSILKDSDCLAEVVQIVRADHFREDAHRTIFKAACALFEDGKRPDAVQVAAFLKRQGQLVNVGGYAFLADLLVDAVPVPASAGVYANLVRDAYLVRELGYAAAEIGLSAADPRGTADEVLGEAERRIFGIAEMGVVGSSVPSAVAIREMRDRIEGRQRRGQSGHSGVLSAFVDLDNMTGGFQDCDLALVAARPSVGKTSFGLCVARAMAVDRGEAVFFASLEQSRVELAERLSCCQAQVSGHKLKRGLMDAEETSRFCDASDVIEQAPIFIDDTPGQSTLRIAANARRLKARHGIRMVIVDYLGLIEPPNPKESRQEQVSAISRGLKRLAKELRLPVLCLAQLNRQSEYRSEERPRLSDLRDSGAQEQDADTVLLLWRPDKQETGRVGVIVAKQRNGPTGDIDLAFRGEWFRFENYAAVPSYGG